MEILKRQEAIKLGKNKYFDGKPCSHGHIAEKYIKSYSCVKCHNLAAKDFKNSTRGKEYQKNYYHKMRDETPEILIYQRTKSRAQKENINFNLTPEYIKSIFPKDNLCPVLGIEMKINKNKDGFSYALTSPSIDKIIPELGYIKENVVIMSMKANLIKNAETNPEVFRKIANWLEKNQRIIVDNCEEYNNQIELANLLKNEMENSSINDWIDGKKPSYEEINQIYKSELEKAKKEKIGIYKGDIGSYPIQKELENRFADCSYVQLLDNNGLASKGWSIIPKNKIQGELSKTMSLSEEIKRRFKLNPTSNQFQVPQLLFKIDLTKEDQKMFELELLKDFGIMWIIVKKCVKG